MPVIYPSPYTFDTQTKTCVKFIDGEYKTLDSCVSANMDLFTANCVDGTCSVDTSGRGTYPSLNLCVPSCPPRTCDTFFDTACMVTFPPPRVTALIRVTPDQVPQDSTGTASIMVSPAFNVPVDSVLTVVLNTSAQLWPLTVSLYWECGDAYDVSVTPSLALRDMETGEFVSVVTSAFPFDKRTGSKCDVNKDYQFPTDVALPTDWSARVTAGTYAWFLLLTSQVPIQSNFLYGINEIYFSSPSGPVRFSYANLISYDDKAFLAKRAKLQKRLAKEQKRAKRQLEKVARLAAELK